MIQSLVDSIPGWRIAHAKASAEVFGKQGNGGTVVSRIGFGQVADGFGEHALALEEARIGAALLLAARFGLHR